MVAPWALLTLNWSAGKAEHPKEVSLSYNNTNSCRHSTNKGTNRIRNVSKLQLTNPGLKAL